MKGKIVRIKAARQKFKWLNDMNDENKITALEAEIVYRTSKLADEIEDLKSEVESLQKIVRLLVLQLVADNGEKAKD